MDLSERNRELLAKAIHYVRYFPYWLSSLDNKDIAGIFIAFFPLSFNYTNAFLDVSREKRRIFFEYFCFFLSIMKSRGIFGQADLARNFKNDVQPTKCCEMMS